MKNIKNYLLIFLFALIAVVATSCGSNKDYVRDLKLTTEYEGKDFGTDGIGEVTLFETVDGDTAWFNSGNKQIKIRFTSVDTPESTGQVEPYGKAASDFTANILTTAKKLVLESHDGKPATLDSTGTRYLGFVWYSIDGTSDFRNLNLELVQNGYSTSKVTEGSKYQDEFNGAATYALENKLNIRSGKEDPDYDYSDGADLTIKEVYENAEQYYGRRVNFEAIVTRKYGNYAYVENDVDGKRYAMLVYLGYNTSVKICFTPGNKLKIHGFVQSYNGMYQISGCTYNFFEYGKPKDDEKYAQTVRILKKNVTLDPTLITASDLNGGTIPTRTLVKIENLQVKSIYQNSEIVDDMIAKEMTLTCTVGTETVQVRVSEIYVDHVPVGESTFRNKFISSLVGIVDVYNDTYQIRLVIMEDVIF